MQKQYDRLHFVLLQLQTRQAVPIRHGEIRRRVSRIVRQRVVQKRKSGESACPPNSLVSSPVRSMGPFFNDCVSLGKTSDIGARNSYLNTRSEFRFVFAYSSLFYIMYIMYKETRGSHAQVIPSTDLHMYMLELAVSFGLLINFYVIYRSCRSFRFSDDFTLMIANFLRDNPWILKLSSICIGILVVITAVSKFRQKPETPQKKEK